MLISSSLFGSFFIFIRLSYKSSNGALTSKTSCEVSKS